MNWVARCRLRFFKTLDRGNCFSIALPQSLHLLVRNTDAAQLYARLGNDTMVKRVQRVSEFGKDMIEGKQLQAKGYKGEMASHLLANAAVLAPLLARCRLPEDYEYPRLRETSTSTGSSAAYQPQNLSHV